MKGKRFKEGQRIHVEYIGKKAGHDPLLQGAARIVSIAAGGAVTWYHVRFESKGRRYLYIRAATHNYVFRHIKEEKAK